MNDRKLDGLIMAAQANPTGGLHGSGLRRAGDELLEQIMATPDQIDQKSDSDKHFDLPPTVTPPPRRRAKRMLAGLAVAASVAAAVVVPTVVFTGGSEAVVVPSGIPATAGDLFIVDEPGWSVSHAHRMTRAGGELWFRRGVQQLEVTWYEADDYQGFIQDRRADDDDPEQISMLGREGLGFSSGPDNHSVLLEPVGRTFVEIREWSSKQDSFNATLRQVRQVTPAEWNAVAASSPDVVLPDREAAAVTAMLADVELPTGFAVSDVVTGEISDHAVLARRAIGLVTCTWLRDYRQALTDGTRPAQRRIEKALRTTLEAQVTRRQVSPADPYPEPYVAQFRRVVERAVESQDLTGYRSELGCE